MTNPPDPPSTLSEAFSTWHWSLCGSSEDVHEMAKSPVVPPPNLLLLGDQRKLSLGGLRFSSLNIQKSRLGRRNSRVLWRIIYKLICCDQCDQI